jgi:prepilin-type N-terminal cleavage/methylation domain-containing protein
MVILQATLVNMMPTSQQSPTRRKLSYKRLRGMTIIETMVTVAITGVLASAAVATFNERAHEARSVEAISMLGSMKQAITVSGLEDGASGGDLNFKSTTFGKPGASEEKSNNGGGNKDGGIDGDGNRGHGNNDGTCDPDNPVAGEDCGGKSAGSGSAAGGSGSSLCGSASPVPSSIENVRGKVYNAPPSAWSSGSSSEGWRCLRMSRSGNQSYQFGYDKGAGTISGASEGFTAWARGDLDGDGRNSLFRIRGNLVGGSVVHGAGVEMVDQTE